MAEINDPFAAQTAPPPAAPSQIVDPFGGQAPPQEPTPTFIPGAGDVPAIVGTPEQTKQYTDVLNKSNIDALRGTAYGAENVVAGLGQTAVQALAKVGVVDPTLNEGFAAAQNELRTKIEGKDPSAATSVGEFMGNALTYSFGLGAATKAIPWLNRAYEGAKLLPKLIASATTGAVIGGTQFSSDQQTDRWSEAMKGAAVGAGAEAGFLPFAKVMVKAANAKIVRQFTNTLSDFAKNFKEDTAALPKFFQSKSAQIESQRAANFAARNDLGDKYHPQVDTSKLTTYLNGLADQAKSRFGTGADTANDIISRAAQQVTPRDAVADAIRGMGLDPADPKNAALVAGLGKDPILAKTPPKAVNYSQLNQTYLDLQSQASRMKQGEQATRLVRDAANKVSDQLKDLDASHPDLLRAAKKADVHFNEVVLPSRTAGFDVIRDAEGAGGDGPTWYKANEKVMDVFTGDDKEMAERLYRTLPPAGRTMARQQVVMRAIHEATNSAGVIDPATFTKYMQDMKAKDVLFRSPQDKAMFKGLENVLNQMKINQGGAKSRTVHYAGTGMTVWGIDAALKMQFGEAGRRIASAMIEMAHVNTVGRMMKSQGGINWLTAASKVTPGTPRAAAMVDQMIKRFAPAAAGIPQARDVAGVAGQAAGIAGQMGGQLAGAALDAVLPQSGGGGGQ